MNRISLAFVASTFSVGGAERVMYELIKRLRPERFDPRLYFLGEAGPVGRELFALGVRGAERLQNGRFDPTVLLRLGRYFRRDKPDIMFALDHHNAMLWGRLAAITCGVKGQIVASHSTGKFGGKRSFRGSDRWLMSFTDNVVALSKTHARSLVGEEGIDPGMVRIIENGIDIEKYHAGRGGEAGAVRDELGLAKTDRVVAMVAVLRPEKAHESMFEAVERLSEKWPGLKVLVVGDGERRAHLEAVAARMVRSGRVQFLGVRSDVARLLRASDVLVLPSHPVVETLPLAVLEAMASGTPVVASRVGSIPEVIEHGENGWLIRPAHALDLAEGIDHILSNPAEVERMCANARATVEERFSADAMVEKYEAMFERALLRH